MNKPDISIIMPGIRPSLWNGVYESILKATKKTFELIIISPFPLTKELEPLSNVKYCKDFGCVSRASNIGCSLAEGKYIFPTMADDALFIEDSIDNNLNFLESLGESSKNIVVCKYSESKDRSAPDRFQDDSYYKLCNAYPAKNIPKDWWIFNTAFWYRKYFDEIGWFDSVYEAAPFSHADIAIRAQRDGANVRMSNFPVLRCDHDQPDHFVIEQTQVFVDTPTFKNKYNQPLDNFTIKLDKENWKTSPSIWNKRFKVNA